MKRQPDHFVALEPVFARAKRWAEDAHLMREASFALPPLVYYDLDPELVKQRKWLQSRDSTMQDIG